MEETFELLHNVQEKSGPDMVYLWLLTGAGGVQTVGGPAPLLASLPEDAAHVPQLLVHGQDLSLQLLQTHRTLGIITLDVVKVFVYVAEWSEREQRLDWIFSSISNASPS